MIIQFTATLWANQQQSKDGYNGYIALCWQLSQHHLRLQQPELLARSSNERAAMLNAGMLALPLKSTEVKKVDWAAALSRYVARAYSKEHAAAHSEQFATVAA